MKKITFVLLVVALVFSVFLTGCITQSASTNTTPGKDLSKTEGIVQSTETTPGPDTGEDKESTDSSRDNVGESYFNIRIVPASELDKLQKEMGQEESLVKNDKDYVIGIISPNGLIIRGDLLQLEQDNGIVGREFDKTDVALHLLDIAYGLDNSQISLFSSDKKYKFWFDGYYSDSEVTYVKNLSQLLNSISGTTQFEDEEVSLGFLQTNYAEIPYHFYNIKIVTEKMLKQLYDDKKDSDHLFKDENGVLIGIVNTDYLYLLGTLSEEDEKYYILKGLLYSMGLHGISYKNPESFFYRNSGVNKNLSDLDIEAIRQFYGGGLKNGDTLEDAKKTLGLPV